VTSRREFSPQTLSVLAALHEQPSQWQHGYPLASKTGLKSGSLYPILIRLADQGLVESSWQEEPVPGRPRRHLYRQTADGRRAGPGGGGAGRTGAVAADQAAWVRDWLYRGQHLTASAAYGRELYASKDVAFYGVICVVFPIIGAIMGLLGSCRVSPAAATGPMMTHAVRRQRVR
jgi:hypothetical protein